MKQDSRQSSHKIGGKFYGRFIIATVYLKSKLF